MLVDTGVSGTWHIFNFLLDVAKLYLSKKNGEKSKFWIPLDPKPISNDQVGSGPCAHTKFLDATWCKVSTGQKNVQKNWLSVSKIREIFCQFSDFFKTFFKPKIWMLMMIFMAKKLIWTVFRCIQFLNKPNPNRL